MTNPIANSGHETCGLGLTEAAKCVHPRSIMGQAHQEDARRAPNRCILMTPHVHEPARTSDLAQRLDEFRQLLTGMLPDRLRVLRTHRLAICNNILLNRSANRSWFVNVERRRHRPS